MANVGSGASGKTFIGAGNGASGTFASIGTNSGLTAHGVVIAEDNGAFTATAPGSSGQVLVSNGAGSDPTFQAASFSGAVTSVTGNTGGAQTPSSGNFNILGTGSITVAGTANTETVQLTGLTNHAVLIGAGTATVTKVGPVASTGAVLQSNGVSSDPGFSTATYPSIAGATGTILRSDGTNIVNTTATYPTTTTVNQVLYSSATNVIGGITATVNSILSTDASGIPSFGTSLLNNYTFTNATGARTVTVSNSDNSSSVSNAVLNLTTGGTSSGDPFVTFVIGSARSFGLGIDNSDSQNYKLTTNASATSNPSTGTVLEVITTGGNRTLPLNGCVLADLNTTITDATGDGTTVSPVIFSVDSGSFFDQNSNYSTSTGLFTAAITGKYLVSAAVSLGDLGVLHTSGIITVFTSAVAPYGINTFNPGAMKDASNQFTAQITMIVSAAAGATIGVSIQVSGSTKTVDILGNNFGSYSRLSINLIS